MNSPAPVRPENRRPRAQVPGPLRRCRPAPRRCRRPRAARVPPAMGYRARPQRLRKPDKRRSPVDQNDSARWKAMTRDDRAWASGRGVTSLNLGSPHWLAHLRTGLQVAAMAGELYWLRATVLQHQDRKQPSQPTSPSRGGAATNDIATTQRHQRRAENLGVVLTNSPGRAREFCGPAISVVLLFCVVISGTRPTR